MPIQIFARLKPLPDWEDRVPYGIEKIDTPDGLSQDDILVFNMKTYNQNGRGGGNHAPSPGPQENLGFRFTKVFDVDSKQEEIFETICKPVIDGALKGSNGTIFTYGQTGSGKTYTMTGSRHNFQERGIIPRTLSHIFEKFQTMEDGTELQAIYISYLEIYNETGYDLLHQSMNEGKLGDLKKVAFLEDSHLKPVTDKAQALHLYYTGLAELLHHKTIAETTMNEEAKRSHSIFTIYIHTRNKTEGPFVLSRRSKVHLVDLAWSKETSTSSIVDSLFEEAQLHDIAAKIMFMPNANRVHIPFRTSVLTSILRDSMGRNCLTSMIATINLEARNLLETLSTCRYAQKVGLLANDGMVTAERDKAKLEAEAEVKRLKTIISQQKEVKQVPSKGSLEGSSSSSSDTETALSPAAKSFSDLEIRRFILAFYCLMTLGLALFYFWHIFN